MKKNGFIATSIMYSFFIVFVLIALMILGTYSHYRILNRDLNRTIKEELVNKINNSNNTSIKVGDYVIMTPTETSYSISSTITGYSSNQTINPSELNLWRVIKKNDDNSIDAVSEYISSSKISFKGTIGYQNLVGGLQEIASHYANTKYTKSVRMMGYDGQTLKLSDTSYFDSSLNTPPSTTSTPTLTSGTGQEYSNGLLGDTLYLKDYLLVGDVYSNDSGLSSIVLRANVVGTSETSLYWIASRMYRYSDDRVYRFGFRVLGDSLGASFFCLHQYTATWYEVTAAYSVRPIITLKSDITISGGAGSKTNPYTLS